MGKISVIVPCYNVSSYLQRCVDSIINQTYSNLEIILVDDGSTDETGELCERLADVDCRIRVLHKDNGGLSDARNAGIDVSTGDYLAFVDGDDYLELDAYEAMVAEMQNSEVSLVSAGILGEDIDGNKSSLISETYQYLTREEAYINLLGNKRTIGQSSCNKLFRSGLFSKLRYKKGIINEDMEILPKILDQCNIVVLLNRPVYHYIKRKGSITELEFSLWKYEAIQIADETVTFCRNRYPALVPHANYYRIDSLFKIYGEITRSTNRKKFFRQELILRFRICMGYLKCMNNKVIKSQYKERLKNIMIEAFFGIDFASKLVRIKQQIMRIE